MSDELIISDNKQADNIKDAIYEIRGQKVMLDRDLAVIYGVETRILNQAVKRNLDRFPSDFMFQLTKEEWRDIENNSIISSQMVMTSKGVDQHEEKSPSELPVQPLRLCPL